jgi:hypothetical protein
MARYKFYIKSAKRHELGQIFVKANIKVLIHEALLK